MKFVCQESDLILEKTLTFSFAFIKSENIGDNNWWGQTHQKMYFKQIRKPNKIKQRKVSLTKWHP